MQKHQKQLLILLPILNLICGVTIDLYAPSLPQIEQFYRISQSLAQNTITITILGFALGQLIFGLLSDHYGRRSTIILALIVYLVATCEIIFCKSVSLLLVGRALQGFACGSFAVNSRALAVDNFSGHDLKIAIVYLSLAWGIGPIVAPYIGGVLVTYLTWQSTFYVLLIYALLLLWFTHTIIKSSNNKQLGFKAYFLAIKIMLLDREFLFRTIILGLCYVQGIIFNLTAPFWVTNLFHQKPAVFGQSALFLGVGYFCGTLLNRGLIKRLKERSLIGFGLSLGVLCSFLFVSIDTFATIYEAAAFIAVINFGAGFIFSNVMAGNLAKYAEFAGICTALQGSLMLIIGATISILVSAMKNPSIHQISYIFLGLTILQLIMYICMPNAKLHSK